MQETFKYQIIAEGECQWANRLREIQAFINKRLKEGMVKSDALHTFKAYLYLEVDSEETQPFRGVGVGLQTRGSYKEMC